MSGFKVISTDGKKKEDCNNKHFIGNHLSIPVSEFVTHMFLKQHHSCKGIRWNASRDFEPHLLFEHQRETPWDDDV